MEGERWREGREGGTGRLHGIKFDRVFPSLNGYRPESSADRVGLQNL